MPFPLLSTLAELDTSTEAIESQLDLLEAALQVSEERLIQTFQAACQTATRLTQQIHAERPDAHWSDRASLEQLIQELKAAADERLNQQRRARVLDLANELDSGRVKHRLEARTTLLNKLRSEAVDELRAHADGRQQTKELPGPKAHEWLVWAFDLDDNKDAEILAGLRRDFPAVERFTAEMEESYWIPGQKPEDSRDSGPPPQAKPRGGSSDSSSATTSSSSKSYNVGTTVSSKRQASDHAEVLARSYERPSESTAAVLEEPVAAVVTRTAPEARVSSEAASPAAAQVLQSSKVHAEEKSSEALVAQAVAAETSGSATDETSAEDESSSELEQPATFLGRLVSRRRSVVAWAGASGFIVLSLLFFGIIYYLHGRNSDAKPVPTVEAATAGTASSPVADTNTAPVGGAAAATTSKPNSPGAPPPAESSSKAPLLNQQPAEGAQDSILLSLENCGRGNGGSIECWGYASNLGGANSRVSLDRVDVVDGRGNSFSLDHRGQFAFPTGQSSYIAAGSRVKFTVTVPDRDLEARSLTLYMDLSNPRSLEYTFRNVPVAE